MTAPSNRRRHLLVRTGFQVRFIALLLLQASLILASLGLVVYSHVEETSQIASRVPVASGAASSPLREELIDRMHVFYVRGLVLVGVTIVIMALFGLLASHKLAGPIVKLDRYLNAAADGDFTQRIAFRDNDHLDDFAWRINATMESLEARRLHAREIGIELARRSRRLDEPTQREQVLNDMEGLLVRLREAV